MHLFETQRLVGRPLSQQDLPVLAEILGDPEVMEYSVRGVCDESATCNFIEWCLGCYVSHGMGPWALVEKGSGELVGFCGVGPEMVGGVEEANLGYRLARRYWGQGLGSEASQGVLDYVFTQKQVASVVVVIEPEHLASLRVAEKAGFKDFSALEFHGRTVHVYRITLDDWKNSILR
ncbi:GNAT family N-acetyltransferase [Pseudomonas gingeri]|uniref:GNAT family N-acetyltransferase n=1 Tax=Pseudomonas gingeri TaxID=117681 RepID=UPI0015A31FA7|nr:GNAT family N-acetyltransferase [Pseudomonas gingeri]NWD71674.1 GNAT family N-acetyltransferase [Pseudomonas gingeri]